MCIRDRPEQPENPFAHDTLLPLQHQSIVYVVVYSIWVNLHPIVPEMPSLPNPVHFSNVGLFARLLSTKGYPSNTQWFPHSSETDVCVHCRVHPARSVGLY